MNLSLYRYAIYDFNRIEVPAYCQLQDNFYVHIQMRNNRSALKRRMMVHLLLFLFTYGY